MSNRRERKAIRFNWHGWRKSFSIVRRLYWRKMPAWGRLMFAASLLGGFVGLVAAWMHEGMEAVSHWALLGGAGVVGPYAAPTRPWLLPLIPAVGGLLAGVLVWRFGPECFGGGTDDVVEAYHQNGRSMRARIIPLKWLTSCLAVGSGGAGGGEGPISQIGGAAGSLFSKVLGLGIHGNRLMLTAGMAAGVGAFFRAPLGGAIFACEIYYSRPDLAAEALLPSLMASVTAYAVFGVMRGFEPLLRQATTSTLLTPTAFLLLTALAMACALGARVLIRGVYGAEKLMKPLPAWSRPAIGGLMAGAVAWIALSLAHTLGIDPTRPGLALGGLGEGYSLLRLAQADVMPGFVAIFGLLGLRLWTSSFTLGSHSPVGSFAPAMVMGGLLGLSLSALTVPFEIGDISPGAFALCGMAGFFAAAFRCPLAAMLMILEVAQGYHMLPALMWVAALAYLLGPETSLVKGQRTQRQESPAERHDF